MKLSKTFGRVATTLVATAMLASVAAPAYAASPANVTITKTITKDADAYAPATTFEFTVAPWTGTATEGALIQAGPEGGVYFTKQGDTKVYSGSITSTPKVSDVDGDNDTLITAGTVGLTVDEDVMKAEDPGIYRYEVKETTPSENPYNGMTYSTETKYFDVYVTVDEETNQKTVSAYMFTDEDAEDGKDDGIFNNDYTAANKTLKVEKILDGTQASPNQEFTFSITINGAANEQYKIVKTNTSGATEDIANVDYLTSGSPASFTLQGGEYITVYGLSANDTYSVSEDDYTSLGYSTTIEVDGSEVGAAPSQHAITDAGDTVTFTNFREASTPTGIVMNVAPYALLVVVAAAGCFVFMRKRRED